MAALAIAGVVSLFAAPAYAACDHNPLNVHGCKTEDFLDPVFNQTPWYAANKFNRQHVLYRCAHRPAPNIPQPTAAECRAAQAAELGRAGP